MFDLIGNLIESTVDVTTDLVTSAVNLELPKRENVLRLAASGLTIYEISQATGLAVDIIQEVLSD